MNLILILDLISLQIGIILTVIVFLRKPPKLLWPSLIFVPIAGAVWSFGELMAQSFRISPEVYEIWVAVLYTGTTLLTISWLHFTLSFAKYINFGLSFDTPKLRRITVLISFGIWVAIVSNHWHGLFIVPNMNSRNDYQILWHVIASYHYGIYLFCLLVLIYLSKVVEEKAHLTQIRIVLVASVFPLALNALFMSQLVLKNFDLTVIGFSFSNMLFVIAIYRYSLFSLSPFTLRSLVFSEADPYLILDPKGSVAVYSKISLDWFGKERLHVGCNGIDLLAERFDLDDFTEGRMSLHHLILNETASFQIRTLDSHNPEWFRITSTVVKNDDDDTLGIGVRLRNVTELVNRNETVTELADVLQGILGSVDQGVAVGSLEGEIIYFNQHFTKMWEISSDNFQEKKGAIDAMASKVLHKERFKDDIARLRVSEETEKGVNTPMRDGRTLQRDSQPINLGSSNRGRLWIWRDITRQLEESKLLDDAKYKSFRAEKLSSLGIMAGGIAHEFNGLLTVILGRAELTKSVLEAKQLSTDNLSAIIASSNRAAELTGQMLSYVGQSIERSDSVRLQTVLEDTLEILESTFTAGMTVKLHYQADPIIKADLVQIGRVITNIIKNSTEALVEGLGSVDITLGETSESPFDTRKEFNIKYAVLSVKDNGRGIAEELIDKIFDPFVTSKFTGRGLGLAAAQGIVKGHDGILKVQSKLNGGTTFTMYLPIAVDGQ